MCSRREYLAHAKLVSAVDLDIRVEKQLVLHGFVVVPALHLSAFFVAPYHKEETDLVGRLAARRVSSCTNSSRASWPALVFWVSNSLSLVGERERGEYLPQP